MECRQEVQEGNALRLKLIRGLELSTWGSNLLTRPVDKKENYIKRCVAIPGDEILIQDKVLMVNGEVAYKPPAMQWGVEKYPKGHYHSLIDSLRNFSFIKDMYEFKDVHYFPVFPNDPQYDWTEDNFGTTANS